MKVEINKIPAEGLELEEELDPQDLELDTDQIKFKAPLKVYAKATKVTNSIRVEISLEGRMYLICGRCLGEFQRQLSQNLALNFIVDKDELFIDLDPEIRQEIILNYPWKVLCKPDCKGLCPRCGADLNKGQCSH